MIRSGGVGYPAVTGDAEVCIPSVNPCAAHDHDAHEFYLDDLHPWDRRDFLSAICGVSEPWHDLCSEGFPTCGR